MASREAAAAVAPEATARGLEQEEHLVKYNALRQELQLLGDKLAELEMEADEHRLVIAALSPLPPTRRCWRKVGGVLVETDVAGALPVLQKTLEGVLCACILWWWGSRRWLTSGGSRRVPLA